MTQKLNIELGEVQETLLIPLFARAEESRKNGLLHDHKAVEIVNSLDYDFSKLKNKPSLKGAVLRTLAYDYLLEDLLQTLGTATIIELGCGLNTRKSRIGREDLQWYDLDMPDVHQLWKVFFEETSTWKFLPYSAFNKQWPDMVKKSSSPPYVFISEASTIYFDKQQNQLLFAMLAKNFPGSYYLFDTATSYFIKNQDSHDTLKLFSARIKWCIDHYSEIESWNPKYRHIKEVNFFLNPPKKLKRKIPWYYKAFIKLYNLINKKAANQYKINVYQLG